jgi:hypothetical protein
VQHHAEEHGEERHQLELVLERVHRG